MWSLGDKYLAQFGENGTYIADWPDVSGQYLKDYEVWAKLSSEQVMVGTRMETVRGVIVYWGKKKAQEKQREYEWELDPNLVTTLSGTALLLALLELARRCGSLPPLEPAYPVVPIIIWPPPQLWGCKEVEGQLVCPGDMIKG